MANKDKHIMPFIERLLNGAKVEWKPLGEVAEIVRGVRVTKNKLKESGFPVVSGGIGYMGYLDEYNREANTITIAQYGTAGYVKLQTERFWANDVCFSVFPSKQITNKFLYYILSNKQEYLYSISNRAAIPYSISKDRILKILIPIPPLSIQEEIVRILDKLTQLEAELEAELDCRKRQYEYYRNRLLSFDMLNRGGQKLNNVTFMALGDVFETRNGYTPSKGKAEFWTSGTIPWFRMEDIRTNGGILMDSIQHITPQAIKGKGLFEPYSIIMATTATIGEHAMLITGSLANQRFTNFKVRKSLSNKLIPKFVYYYFFVIDEWCKQHVNVSSFPSVDIEQLKKQPFPLPPLAEQQRIVSILDKFDTLTTSISEGLPKEIELRRKQYEYYRNELLSFQQ